MKPLVWAGIAVLCCLATWSEPARLRVVIDDAPAVNRSLRVRNAPAEDVMIYGTTIASGGSVTWTDNHIVANGDVGAMIVGCDASPTAWKTP